MLFVDDSQENRRIFKRLLEHMGMAVTVESKPLKTIPLMEIGLEEGTPFQLVVLDHNMPVNSGLDVGMTIRNMPRFDPTKLLIFSSVGEKGDSAIFARAGFDAYLNKLSRYETLRSMLSATLEHESGQPLITQHSIEEAKISIQSDEIKFNATVLVAEDVLPNQIIAKKLLTNMGIQVAVANDGEEAVAAYKENNFDLIFMDCRMPEMDGYDATQAIRDIEQKDNATPIPIIALTANASTDDQTLCINVGMNDVVTKPFKRSDLSICLQQWLPDAVVSD